MGTVILISTVAILVAIVGCFFIWRLDAARAEEVDQPTPPQPAASRLGLAVRSRLTAVDRLLSTRPAGTETPTGGACHTRTGVVRGRPRGRFEGTTSVCTELTRRNTMGLDDKISNKGEELKGKGKEAAGKATDDESLEAEGKGDQAGANLKQAGEKVKDVFKG